jgi:hypothetical protein
MMRAVRTSVLLIVLALGAGSSRAQVAAGGNSRERTKTMVESYPLKGHAARDQVFKLGVADGLLVPELVAGDLPQNFQPARFEVDGTPGPWVVRSRANNVSVWCYDFGAPEDQAWSAAISFHPSLVSVYAQIGENVGGSRVRLIQNNGRLTFTVMQVQPRVQAVTFTATASTLRQLQAEHPREVRTYLAPILRSLSGRTLLKPEPGDVYAAFTEIRPDPVVDARLREILERLGSDEYAVRDRASRDLADLGTPGVLAAVRRDGPGIAPEARARLEAFIAANSGMSSEQVVAARRDPTFLIECLDDEDRAVRLAAKGALEKLLGKAVTFDVDAGPTARVGAIEGLYKKVTPATPTTTTAPVK